MKKIVTAADLGGAPFTKADLRTVFNDELWDAMEAIFAPYATGTEGLIISGCVTANPGAGIYTVSAGIVFLNGMFMRLTSGIGISLPLYIVPAATVNDDRVFVDTATKTLFETKDAEVTSSIPGAGQYIAITTLTDPDDRRWKPVIGDANLRIKKLTLSDWDMYTTASKTKAHGLTDSKILSVSVNIQDSAVGKYHDLVQSGTINWSSTDIEMARTGGGTFDSASFTNTAIKITIIYEL